MFWSIVAPVIIGVLAYAIRKGVKGTRFVNNCGCTPNMDHLRYMEKGEKKKPDNLW